MCRGTSACGNATRFSGKSGSSLITAPGSSGSAPRGVDDDDEEEPSAAGGQGRGLLRRASFCRLLWGTETVLLPLVEGGSEEGEAERGCRAATRGAMPRRIGIIDRPSPPPPPPLLLLPLAAHAGAKALALRAIVNERKVSFDGRSGLESWRKRESFAFGGGLLLDQKKTKKKKKS